MAKHLVTRDVAYRWQHLSFFVLHAGLSEVLDRQHLFSVYVHLPPNKTLSGPPSIFHGRDIPGSIPTAWGEWSLANASRVLIRHALITGFPPGM